MPSYVSQQMYVKMVEAKFYLSLLPPPYSQTQTISYVKSFKISCSLALHICYFYVVCLEFSHFQGRMILYFIVYLVQTKLYLDIIMMMILKWVIICLVVLTANTKKETSSQDKPYFPKILWVFWDTGYESADLFTKLCINNMAHFSKESGWEFNFLTLQNYTKFISTEGNERINTMYQKSKHQLKKQNFADLLRLILIYQNGGMWLDTNSFFIGDLSWIENLDKEIFVYNKISQAPDILTFSLNRNMGGNKTQLIDPRTNSSVYLFPGVQIWSFISRSKSKFLKDVLNSLQYSLDKQRYLLDEQLDQQGIMFDMEKDIYYITSNYQFQIVLQRKQKQIEANRSLFDQLYSVEYYKMWTIEAIASAYSIKQINKWFPYKVVDSLFHNSLDKLVKEYNIPRYFFKFNGQFYHHIDNVIRYNQLINYGGVNAHIDNGSVFDEYLLQPSASMGQVIQLRKSPSAETCNFINNFIWSYLDQFLTLIKIGLSLFFIISLLTIRKIYKNGHPQSLKRKGFQRLINQ